MIVFRVSENDSNTIILVFAVELFDIGLRRLLLLLLICTLLRIDR